MMKWALEQHGYRVLIAETGVEAVETAEREHPDLILMDLHLPVLDGLEATRRIRQHEQLRDVPIVGTSTVDTPEIEAAAFAAGCTAFRRQPVDFDKFGEIADLILHRHTGRTTASKRDEEASR